MNKTTETEKNIAKAFIGESQARNKYSYFSSLAKKEGYISISKLFEKTSKQEKQHSKSLLKLLNSQKVTLTDKFSVFRLGSSTIENLKTAISGEEYEYKTIYPSFEKIARKEKQTAAAKIFSALCIAEKQHAEEFKYVLSKIERNEFFSSTIILEWYCINCGYITSSKNAPMECPACSHPTGYFKRLPEIDSTY